MFPKLVEEKLIVQSDLFVVYALLSKGGYQISFFRHAPAFNIVPMLKALSSLIPAKACFSGIAVLFPQPSTMLLQRDPMHKPKVCTVCRAYPSQTLAAQYQTARLWRSPQVTSRLSSRSYILV